MTGMEHATEQAPIVKVAESFEGEGPVHDATILMMKTWGEQEPSHGVSQHPASYVATFVDMARALADAGLLAPAPLREEWGSEVRDVRPDRDPYVLWAIDLDNAQWQIEHNPDWATGRIMHRYRTDWLPVDRAEGDGRADRPSWVDEHGINHADGGGGRW